MNNDSNAYANDEDVALVAAGDVGPLFPSDQEIAAAADGVFGPSDRWMLQSASVDFLAAGLRPGHVVRLVGPIERFRAPGALLGVAEVSAGGVTLRRIGMEQGSGAPVAPIDGLTGVEFVATTLGPQLSQASRVLDRLLGLDPAVPGRRPEDLVGSDVLRDAVVRLVLARRYTAIARDGDGSFRARSEAFRAEFDEIIARSARRGGFGGTATRFGTRIVR